MIGCDRVSSMRLPRYCDRYGVDYGISKYVYVLCCLTKFEAWIGRALGNIGGLTGDEVGYRRSLSRDLETMEIVSSPVFR